MSTPGGAAFHVTASGPVAQSGGVLHTVVVNTGASGATLTLHDGTTSSGAVIAVLSAAAPGTFVYDAVLGTGLYAAVSGSPDVTVVIVP